MEELAGTTVVLADDHAAVREGIAALCSSHGMRVLGQVADGDAAIYMIADLNPDFAILDLYMPG
jgi:DNA-binding NarL/FixJ family response regulator